MLNQETDVDSFFVEEVRADDVRYVVDIGNLSLILPVGIQSEVIEIPEYTALPLMPDKVVGLCNLRGNLVPVFDLDKHLDLEEGSQERFLIALGEGDEFVGVLLESLPYLVQESDLVPTRQLPMLPETLSRYISNSFKKEGSVLLEYDHHAFFASFCG